jgi:hypothetical protein
VSVLFTEVADPGGAGLEDPQAEYAEECDLGEVVRVRRQPGGGDQRLEPQVAQAQPRRLS